MDNQKTKKQTAVDELKTISQPKTGSQQKQGNDELKIELEAYKKLAEEYKTKYLRALADYQNFEKRTIDNRQQLLVSANSGLVLKLLPFLDSLDKAEIFVKDRGLQIVKDQLLKVLKEAGLEEIDVLNKEYDPYVSEVIDMVEGKKDNIVVEVLRKGYKFQGNILRVAQVKVSKQKI